MGGLCPARRRSAARGRRGEPVGRLRLRDPPPGARSPLPAVIRKGLVGLAVAWLLYLLVPLSSTGLAYPECVVLIVVTLLLTGSSLALAVTRGPLRRSSAVVCVALAAAGLPLMFLFTHSQSVANPLFRLRFLLSRPALDRAAEAARTRGSLATPAWIGLFPVRRVDVYDGEVRFMSDGCGLIDECGLLHRPGARPAGRGKTSVQHLDGPWYHLYSVF